MKTVRKSVFETNSSSMHSLAIIGADRLEKDYDYDKSVIVKSNEYGWSGDDLTIPLEKLSYITTMIQYKDSGEVSESIYLKWLQEMFKDYTGSELVYESYDINDKWYKNGYIDHQSTDILDDVWSEDEETFKKNMKDIVFNKKYFIIIDNDNH